MALTICFLPERAGRGQRGVARGLAAPGWTGAGSRLPPPLHLLHRQGGRGGPRQVQKVRPSWLHRPPGCAAQPYVWSTSCSRPDLGRQRGRLLCQQLHFCGDKRCSSCAECRRGRTRAARYQSFRMKCEQYPTRRLFTYVYSQEPNLVFAQNCGFHKWWR